MFALATLPAFAGPGLAGDSADAPAAPASSVTSALVASPLRSASSDVLFASDVNQMIAAQAALAQSAPKEEGRVQTLVKRGLALLGTPYRWGGNSPEGGFDCSGLVGYVFRTALGIDLPRVSRDMARDGEKVERAALVPGDLVFFGRRGKRVDHVGIYIGEGRFLHAPRSGRDVTVSQLDTGYWSGKFLQARRVAGLGTES
ncbi:C40 family peptidase [Luteimonas sp. SDU82]|uniref:C40 family peptidase n=1 Tax=Luteimonas sp. SDU82 TaxID=3422592 RepID=UPI003EBEE7BB